MRVGVGKHVSKQATRSNIVMCTRFARAIHIAAKQLSESIPFLRRLAHTQYA